MNDEPDPNTGESTSGMGKWMIIALWILILGFGTFFAQKWLDKRARGQIPVNISSPNGKLSVQLESDGLGHYIVEGLVNGEPVTFLVDTGASGVSIPGNVAKKLALKPGSSYPVATANGTITVRGTTISELAIGNLSLQNVEASINSSMNGDVGLLGMTFLRHFELVQRDGLLTIREP